MIPTPNDWPPHAGQPFCGEGSCKRCEREQAWDEDHEPPMRHRRHPHYLTDFLAVVGGLTVLAGVTGTVVVVAIDAGRRVRAGRRAVGT